MKESDSARTARLVAIMAGNAFVLVQMYQFYMEVSKNTPTPFPPFPKLLFLTATVSIIGMMAAYAALAWPTRSIWQYILEGIGGASFLLPVLIWLRMAWKGL
jgi:hypothetical protein